MPWFWEHLPPWEGSYGLSGPALGKAGEPESGEGGPTAGRPAGWLWVRFEPGSPARVPWLLWEWAEAGLLGPVGRAGSGKRLSVSRSSLTGIPLGRHHPEGKKPQSPGQPP